MTNIIIDTRLPKCCFQLLKRVEKIGPALKATKNAQTATSLYDQANDIAIEILQKAPSTPLRVLIGWLSGLVVSWGYGEYLDAGQELAKRQSLNLAREIIEQHVMLHQVGGYPKEGEIKAAEVESFWRTYVRAIDSALGVNSATDDRTGQDRPDAASRTVPPKKPEAAPSSERPSGRIDNVNEIAAEPSALQYGSRQNRQVESVDDYFNKSYERHYEKLVEELGEEEAARVMRDDLAGTIP